MCAVAPLPHLLLNGVFCSGHPIPVLYRVYVGCDGGGERKLMTCLFNQQLSNLRTRIKGAAPNEWHPTGLIHAWTWCRWWDQAQAVVAGDRFLIRASPCPGPPASCSDGTAHPRANTPSAKRPSAQPSRARGSRLSFSDGPCSHSLSHRRSNCFLQNCYYKQIG